MWVLEISLLLYILPMKKEDDMRKFHGRPILMF